MEYQVLGRKIGSFTNDSGQIVNFGQLHCLYKDPDVEGQAVELVKVNPVLINSIKPGDKVRFDRNAKGRVLNVELVH